MNLATGHYLNIFDDVGYWDVFLILNEANEPPTAEECTTLQTAVETAIQSNHSTDRKWMRKVIADAVDATNVTCIGFGFQVVLR